MKKEELELLIAEERTLGEFVFNEDKQCFETDVEVSYELIQLDKNSYKSGEYIYFDGYEYEIEEAKKKVFTGTLEEVQEQLAEEYNEENGFMGYPVIYTNFSVELV